MTSSLFSLSFLVIGELHLLKQSIYFYLCLCILITISFVFNLWKLNSFLFLEKSCMTTTLHAWCLGYLKITVFTLFSPGAGMQIYKVPILGLHYICHVISSININFHCSLIGLMLGILSRGFIFISWCEFYMHSSYF